MIFFEALSPPKPAESLRERLIREGTIVPTENLDSLTQKIIDAKLRLLEIIKFTEDRRGSYIGFCDYIINSFAVSAPKLPAYLNAFLVLKKIENFETLIFGNRKNKFNLFNIYRCGFFFAFKENKKNTP